MQITSAWIGFDPREVPAYAVARASMRRHLPHYVPIKGLVLDDLQRDGLYTRKTERRLGKLWDHISEAPMATEFAISRFLVPHLARTGLALFTDCDVMVRTPLSAMRFERNKAVWCVKHNHVPDYDLKMDGQEQTRYARKNWSSVMVFDCDHPSNKKLTPELVNGVPGRDLHRFCWLEDHEIGELDPSWNFLVGHSEGEADIVHFTDGGPWFSGFENIPYADEWRAEFKAWAR